jgi:hypothetical protein
MTIDRNSTALMADVTGYHQGGRRVQLSMHYMWSLSSRIYLNLILVGAVSR